MMKKPKESLLFNAFLVMFIIHSTQFGLGAAGVQRVLYKEAKQDAWVSILLAGLVIHFIIWIMIQTLKKFEDMDLFQIHLQIYGKFIGKSINFIYGLYLYSTFVTIVLGYIEIVQGWVFSDLESWIICAFLVFITFQGVSGGIRMVAGICFLSIVLSMWIFFFLIPSITYSHWDYLLPIMEAPPKDLLKGMIKTSYTMLGFEILYCIYPFIKEKDKANKYAQIGVLITTLLVALLMVLAISYFSPDQLSRTIWATLSMYKIVKIPNLERFEYVAVVLWMLIIASNLVVYMWAATRAIKSSIGLKQKTSLYVLCAITIGISIFVEKRSIIDQFINYVGKAGLYIVFLYPFLLYMISIFIKKKKANNNEINSS
ncbi:MAG: gerAB [Neobacillus sp.]|nr:gerAB [Neobacillus sp.]